MRCGEWLHCYASAHSVETYHAPPVGSRFRSPFDWAVTKPYLRPAPDEDGSLASFIPEQFFLLITLVGLVSQRCHISVIPHMRAPPIHVTSPNDILL